MRIGVLIVLLSVLTGALAAGAAVAISALTSAKLLPSGAALLGGAFGVAAGPSTLTPRTGPRRAGVALFRGAVAGGTAALIVALSQ